MAAYVYVLASTAGERVLTYVGWTFDVERRLAQHNAGKGARFTKGRCWRLVHVETMPDASAARRREVALKRDRALRTQLRDAFALTGADGGVPIPQQGLA